MTSHCGPTVVRNVTEYHFTFSFDSTLCKWEWILHRELYSVTPAAVRYNYLSAGSKPNPNPDSWPFEPKINRLRQTVEVYYCAKFRVISIMGFHFIMLTCTPTYTPHTHPHTHHTHITYPPHPHTTHPPKFTPHPHTHTHIHITSTHTHPHTHHTHIPTTPTYIVTKWLLYLCRHRHI